MARLRAASLIHTLDLAQKEVGIDRLRELVATLPRETQELFNRQLTASDWIEADHFLPFQQALLYEHFDGDEMPFRAFIRRAREREFNVFSKLFIRAAWPAESLLRRTARRWSSWSDSGRLEVAREKIEVGRRVNLKLTAFKSEFVVFGIVLHAFVEHLMEMTGARAPEVRRPVNRVVLGEVETDLVVEYG
jgi:hypothetical protein